MKIKAGRVVGLPTALHQCACGRRCKGAGGLANHVQRCVVASGEEAVQAFHRRQYQIEREKSAAKREAEHFQRQRLHDRAKETGLFDRWSIAERHRRATEMWLRTGMLSTFTKEEIDLLDGLGLLCRLDLDLLRQMSGAVTDPEPEDGDAPVVALPGPPDPPKDKP